MNKTGEEEEEAKHTKIVHRKWSLSTVARMVFPALWLSRSLSLGPCAFVSKFNERKIIISYRWTNGWMYAMLLLWFVVLLRIFFSVSQALPRFLLFFSYCWCCRCCCCGSRSFFYFVIVCVLLIKMDFKFVNKHSK